MRRLIAITTLCVLFSTAFVAGRSGASSPDEGAVDTLSALHLYTEGVKRAFIDGDSARARALFHAAIARDSAYAPAYYALASNGLFDSTGEAVELARAAYLGDTTNKWYHLLYGQTLVIARRYREALGVYRKLQVRNPEDPDNYRILAALYEANNDPYMALVTLDSAELRFGRIPLLGRLKRRLLLVTGQNEKAVEEARRLVEEAPYDQENRLILAEIYSYSEQDSLALAEYGAALRIDSTNLDVLTSLADFHNARKNTRELLSTTRRIFELESMPLDEKIKRFGEFTSDRRFYGQNFLQIDELATTLAIRYPADRRVVELYAGHLIASGELDRALELYKLHLADRPPVREFYVAVIDIESYRERPDSARHYIAEALELFPKDVTFHLMQGSVYYREKRYDKVLEAYDRALDYAATDSVRSSVWAMKGDIWHQIALGENPPADDEESHARMLASRAARRTMKRAYKAYDRSLELWGDNVLAMNNYAYFLSLEGRELERALAMSSRVVELTGNNPTYLDTHAWVLYKLGRYAEAKRTIQQAVAFDEQESPELLLHYGDILDALGEHFSATIYWRKALEKGASTEAVERRIEAQRARKEQRARAAGTETLKP